MRLIILVQYLEVIDTPGFLDSSGSDLEVIGEIYDFLMNYREDGFSICVIPFSALEMRFDGGTIQMLNMVKSLLGQSVIKHIFIVITQLNKVNPSYLRSELIKIKN